MLDSSVPEELRPVCVVVSVRVTNATGFEQWCRFRSRVAFLAVQDPRELLWGIGISLWVRSIAAGRVVIEAISVQVIPCRAHARGRRRIVSTRLNLVVDGEVEQDPLHHGCQQEYAPRTPAAPAQPCEETAGKEQSARRLDAHHRNTKTSDVLQMIRGPDLREVLHRGKKCSHDPEHLSPQREGIRRNGGEDSRDHDHGKTVKEGQRGHQQGSLPPRRLAAKLLLRHV